jgi:hypothetical protein
MVPAPRHVPSSLYVNVLGFRPLARWLRGAYFLGKTDLDLSHVGSAVTEWLAARECELRFLGDDRKAA